MKRILVFAALLLPTALFAQGLSIGGRIGTYSTDIDSGFSQVDTGRASTAGFLVTYRNNGLVIDGALDHDFESDVALSEFLPVDFSEYQRDRIEAGVGYSVLPALDLMGGFRTEEISLGGDFFGFDFADDLNFDHQAFFAGVNLHTPTIRPVGFYLSGRGYLGSAEFDVDNDRVKDDTTGVKLEAGIPIALGLSGWELTPGVEWERLETDRYNLNLDTNRFFISFRYTTGR